MAYRSPTEANNHLRDRVLEGIKTHFPLEGRDRTVHLTGLEVQDLEGAVEDLDGQKQKKVEGKTFSTPVYANLELKDNATGKTLSKERMRLAEIPIVTKRYSHIIDGQEYQIDNQWQLKEGVYTHRNQRGEIISDFNTPARGNFKIRFEPGKKLFLMKRGKSERIPVYPLMKAMGIDDDTLEREWGKDILEANKKARGANTALNAFYRADKKRSPKDDAEATQHFLDTMEASKLKPESTELTLGKRYTNVTSEVLRKATSKMLKVQAGADEDDRDALLFKRLRTVGDYAYDKLKHWGTARSVKSKARKINTTTNIKEIIKFDTFNNPIIDVFKKDNAAARLGAQVNPVEMLSSSQQTTILGPGGISSEQVVSDAAKYINPTHMGFVDPLRTPEGEKTGITLRLPMGVRKKGEDPMIPLFNLKTNKVEEVNPLTFSKSKVVMPDQVKWVKGKPVAISRKVKMSGSTNELEEGSLRGADYVMTRASQMFNVTTNLMPFLGTTSGNRATYAGQHIEQAISLAKRQAPLVQVATGSNKEGMRTFEELIGKDVASHSSPVSGKVVQVKSNRIVIKDKAGKRRIVQIYDNFPLNDPKSVLHSTPLVKVGDEVKAKQTIADTNFTRDGKLALGTNLNVAYIPYKGLNFEDGVVISESASEQLSSIHMYKPDIVLDQASRSRPKDFQVQHPDAFSPDQLKKMDEQGRVRVGQKVKPGDPLILATKPYKLRDRFGIASIRRSLSGQHTDTSLKWDSDAAGTVVGVHKNKKGKLTVHVRTIEPMRVGDKLAGRYGNKGIVSRIIPDKDMPHTKDGEHVQVALNPSGVPGRMNIGQVLETAAAKIAKKTGKTYMVESFEAGVDMLAKVKGDLKRHNLSDTEELFDPTTGVSLGKALVGPQHIIKLTHQIDKKTSVRSGMNLLGEEPLKYDLQLMPSSGGKTGGQSMGPLGLYSLLAHGAKANIREMQTWKSEGEDPQPNEGKRWASQHSQVWKAIQEGDAFPTPKPTFGFSKFTDMLRGAGINIEKKGHNLQLSPMTDEDILKLSNGELPKPGDLLYAKLDKNGDPKPKQGGLFDPRITGGHGGKKWSHMKLAEPIPNPVFEGAIQKLTGLKQAQFASIVHGKKALTKGGKIVDVGTPNSMTGGPAIKGLLDKIDVNKELPKMEKELMGLSTPKNFGFGGSTQKIDTALKKVKYLRALKEADLTPSKAYILNNLPILPPALRPASVLPDGNINWADINGLYQAVAQENGELKDPYTKKYLLDTDKTKQQLRENLYDGVKAVMGVGKAYGDQTFKGLLHQISGSVPKKGYFQKSLLTRRQDLTMRSVIVPEPALGLDEVGLPREKAMSLYRPFIAKKMVEMGAAANIGEARKMIKEKHPIMDRALEMAAEERPVLLKRDPVLHKYSVQAFKPRIVAGKAIQIHPLITGGYNADFDGDTMSAYVPIHPEAVAEARSMFPSNNLFSEASGKVAYQPALESALGLYKLSRVSGDSGKKFKKASDAIKAVKDGKVKIDQLVSVGGKKTTAGRMLISAALPKAMRNHPAITNHKKFLDKKGIDALFTTLARNHKGDFGDVANKLKDLGNGMSYGAVEVKHPSHKGAKAIVAAENAKSQKIFLPTGTHTLSLDDFEPDRKTRDRILGATQKRVDSVYANKNIPKGDRDRRAAEEWDKAAVAMEKVHRAKMEKNPNNLFMMLQAGVKPSWTQYKQMALAPVQVNDAAGRPVPMPIKKSYAEGLDVAGYWTQAHGARRGTIMKVQEVKEPGLFSKQLINATMNLVINGEDCKTTRGVSLAIGGDDINDRELAVDFKAKGLSLPAGTLLTTDVVGKMRTADKRGSAVVRTALKCEHGTGLCKKCAGIGADGKHYSIGTNLGILAAQSLGERAVQLTMKAFHTGGVRSAAGSKTLGGFARVQQLTKLPDTIPNSTQLAMRGGKIEKITRGPTGVNVIIGGTDHFVGKDMKGLGLHQSLPGMTKVKGYKPWKPPKVGMSVQAGQPLSDPNRTYINPRDLYKATRSMERVQNYLVDELHAVYKDEGIRRPHVETVVKAMANVTKVDHPGDANNVLRGEFRPTSVVFAQNKKLEKAGKRPIIHQPVLKGINMIPQTVVDDWMARLNHEKLRQTIMDGAAMGAVSNLHGIHPIPGMAYGAEFGLTLAHHKQPGLKHLANVPRHAY